MRETDTRTAIVKSEVARGRNNAEIDTILRSRGFAPIDPAKDYTDAVLLRIVEHREATLMEEWVEAIYDEASKIASPRGKTRITDRDTLIAFLKEPENRNRVHEWLEGVKPLRSPRRLKELAFDLAAGDTALDAKSDMDAMVTDGFYRSIEDIALLYAFERNAFVGTPGGPQHFSTPQEVIDLVREIRKISSAKQSGLLGESGNDMISLDDLRDFLKGSEDENRMTKQITREFYQSVFPGFQEGLDIKEYRTKEQFLADVTNVADKIALVHERTRRELVKQIVKYAYSYSVFGRLPLDPDQSLFDIYLLDNSNTYSILFQGENEQKAEDLQEQDLQFVGSCRLNVEGLCKELFLFLHYSQLLSQYLNTNDIEAIDSNTLGRITKSCLIGAGDITRTFFLCWLSFIQAQLTRYFNKAMSLPREIHIKELQRIMALFSKEERTDLLEELFKEAGIQLPEADIAVLSAICALPSKISCGSVRDALSSLEIHPRYDYLGYFALLAQLCSSQEHTSADWLMSINGMSLTSQQKSWLNEFCKFLCHKNQSGKEFQNLIEHRDVFSSIEKELHDCREMNLAEFSDSKRSPFEVLLKQIRGYDKVIRLAFIAFFHGKSVIPIQGRIYSNEKDLNDILINCGWTRLNPRSGELEFAYDRVAHVVFCSKEIESELESKQIPDYKHTVWGSFLGSLYSKAGTNLTML